MFGARFRGFLQDDRGTTAIEYGLIGGLIVLAMLSGVGGYTEVLNLLWMENAQEIKEGLEDR